MFKITINGMGAKPECEEYPILGRQVEDWLYKSKKRYFMIGEVVPGRRHRVPTSTRQLFRKVTTDTQIEGRFELIYSIKFKLEEMGRFFATLRDYAAALPNLQEMPCFSPVTSGEEGADGPKSGTSPKDESGTSPKDEFSDNDSQVSESSNFDYFLSLRLPYEFDQIFEFPPATE